MDCPCLIRARETKPFDLVTATTAPAAVSALESQRAESPRAGIGTVLTRFPWLQITIPAPNCTGTKGKSVNVKFKVAELTAKIADGAKPKKAFGLGEGLKWSRFSPTATARAAL